MKELATLPSPYLDGSLDPSAYPGMLWELSRGCPFRCDFCFESRGTEGTRRVPMDRVKAELLHFEACEVSQVFVLVGISLYILGRKRQLRGERGVACRPLCRAPLCPGNAAR